jgi:RNA polymerase sigma factor (TIGR02999 family)
MIDPSDQVTEILNTPLSPSERMDRLLPVIYSELRALAHQQLRQEYHPSETLNTTSLVHEAYLKLFRPASTAWDSRAHFFGAASRAMRQVLVEYARSRMRLKRGQGAKPLRLDETLDILSPERSEEVLALNEALGRLETLDWRQGRVVECRYFGGLTVEQTADVLGTSASTVKREWRTAKLWLYKELSPE